MRTIYDLKLHEQICVDRTYVLRVAGGWIYQFSSSSVFVPLNNEFLMRDLAQNKKSREYE